MFKNKQILTTLKAVYPKLGNLQRNIFCVSVFVHMRAIKPLLQSSEINKLFSLLRVIIQKKIDIYAFQYKNTKCFILIFFKCLSVNFYKSQELNLIDLVIFLSYTVIY